MSDRLDSRPSIVRDSRLRRLRRRLVRKTLRENTVWDLGTEVYVNYGPLQDRPLCLVPTDELESILDGIKRSEYASQNFVRPRFQKIIDAIAQELVGRWRSLRLSATDFVQLEFMEKDLSPVKRRPQSAPHVSEDHDKGEDNTLDPFVMMGGRRFLKMGDRFYPVVEG